MDVRMPWPKSIAWRAIGMGTGLSVMTLLWVGLPSAVIPNPWFTRMIPTRPQDYLFLALTTLLAAALGATYALPSSCSLEEGKLTAGGILSLLAIGCPICNKIVVVLLGVSGALTFFEPIQPLLGLLSIGLFGYAIMLRLKSVGLLGRLLQKT